MSHAYHAVVYIEELARQQQKVVIIAVDVLDQFAFESTYLLIELAFQSLQRNLYTHTHTHTYTHTEARV